MQMCLQSYRDGKICRGIIQSPSPSEHCDKQFEYFAARHIDRETIEEYVLLESNEVTGEPMSRYSDGTMRDKSLTQMKPDVFFFLCFTGRKQKKKISHFHTIYVHQTRNFTRNKDYIGNERSTNYFTNTTMQSTNKFH